MTNLDKILTWAPDYPWAFSTVQTRDAVGIPIGKIGGILQTARKYGIVEYVGVIDGIGWWRKSCPDGAEPRPVVFHTSPPRQSPQRPLFASTEALRAWVEALPVGTRFHSSDVIEATGIQHASLKLHRFDDLLEIADRGGRIHGRITWRRI